jgi:hypothetical protein
MTAAERAAKLAAMQADADTHTTSSTLRLQQSDARAQSSLDTEAAAAPEYGQRASFIAEMAKDMYMSTDGKDEKLADRISKNKHYRQKGNMDDMHIS